MSKLTGKPKKRQASESFEEETKPKRRQAPGRTVEDRQNKIINLAYDLVEARIRRGTATSQEVTEFIRMGSNRTQLELKKLEKENELLIAKTKSLESQKTIEKLYSDAMKAFGRYRGNEVEDDSED